MVILGINGALNWDGNIEHSWVHGSGVSLIVDQEWKGSMSEERFSRIKYDGNFPIQSIKTILLNNKLSFDDVDIVAYATNLINDVQFPLSKLFVINFLKSFFKKATVEVYNHHDCHAASTFFTSPFEESNIFTLDSCGDNFYEGNDRLLHNYGSFGIGSKKSTSYLRISSLYYDNNKSFSIGDFYASMSKLILDIINTKKNVSTSHINKHVLYEGASGKVMGLSGYGKPIDLQKNIFGVVQDSKYALPHIFTNVNYHDFAFISDIIKYEPEDLAFWVQVVFENTVLDYLDKIPKSLKNDNLCFGGGCALNISLNSKIISEKVFKDLHICPAPNDDGLSLGSALLALNDLGLSPKLADNLSCVGNQYPNLFVADNSIKNLFNFEEVEYSELYERITSLLIENKIIAWFQGKSEFGPRALCNRSILANPCFDNKELLNVKVKKREYWRPYASVVLEEHLDDWFNCPKQQSPYMLFNSVVRENKLNIIPGVVHVDNTCRIQTVNIKNNKIAYDLLKMFYKKTGIPLLLNTSFNTISGEPIVETPLDALRSFSESNIDVLVINNTIITRKTNETHIEPNIKIGTY